MSRTRTQGKGRLLALGAAALVTLVAACLPRLDAADLRPDYQPAAYAIKGARIATQPGSVIENGTVVVRRGVIEAVGQADAVTVPYDAEVIDGKGLVVYPGFLDLYTTLGVPTGASRSQTGAGRNVPYGDFALPRTPEDNRSGLTPEFEVASVLDLPENLSEDRRKLGFTSLLAAPGGAIASGQSALASTSGLTRREAILKAPVALHVQLGNPSNAPFPEGHDCEATADEPQPNRRRPGLNYPTSLMGVVAHLRQAMIDAQHDVDTRAYVERFGGPRPPFDPTLRALQAARTKALPVWWEANSRDEILRVLDLADEFGTSVVIVGGAEAYKVADRLKQRDVPVVLRLDFPEEPKVPTEADYRKRPPEERLEPLRVLNDRAAKWKERVGCAAALAKAGVRFAFASDGLPKPDQFHAQVRKLIAAGLPADAAVDALTRRAAEIAGLGGRLGTIENGKLGHLVALTTGYGDEKGKVRYILADGIKFDTEKTPGRKKSDEAPKPKEEKPTPKPEGDKPPAPEVVKPKDEAKPDPAKPKGAAEEIPPVTPFVDVAAELDDDRRPRLKTGGNVLIRDATILTVTRAGTMPRGSILVRGGKIAALGLELEPPAGTTVIDAAGMVAMPGIIDTHSHMAIQGGVNEISLSIVPEVRVRDVVTGEDPTIYRALAGGTTAARLLHGSANTIGGQDAIVKLKHGQAGRDMTLSDPHRPQGVKFALGENVTRVPGRFPNTRMGVEATIERAFQEAKVYRERWDAYKAAAADPKLAGPPPRRDLRLEALAGILDGSLKIHSHCYRNDEILMLMRLAERHGVRVQSLQHVLEGYKVAPEIAAHGASASTFSDWWAYKVEAYDAIPYNAALLTEAGAKVCIKSDSEELVRHLYLEAAKMVRYGGVSELQALEMITINPARELGLDHRMGSIEVGKDADVALFNAHPFDTYARCELALIDGEVAFQRRSADPRLVPRPGDHLTMPAPSAEARGKAVESAFNPRGLYAIVGATLHPVSGPDVKDGTLVIADGKIAALGGSATVVPPGAQTVDARGLDVWPGMIDAGGVVGLFEIGSLRETRDYADSAQYQPELNTSIALHPDSELIPVTRANGVLTTYAQPEGGIVAGQGCVIDLNGWVPAEMVLLDGAALNINIPPYTPPNPNRPRTGDDDPNRQRHEKLEAIKDLFRRAKAYDAIVAEAKVRKVAPPEPDPRLSALAPFAKGEKLVIFHAERRLEILDALKLIEALRLKAAISGGLEAWKAADALKAAHVPVIVGGTLKIPLEATDPYDAAYANPARLFEAGVSFVIRSGGQGPDQATSARNLPFEAGVAVAYGLPEAEALRAVTLGPAQLLGVGDQLGSLDVGKRANLVITAGPLLQVTSEVKALFMGGRPVSPESKHTRLYAKYRQRLAEVRAGTARLGLDRNAPSAGTPGTAVSAPAGPADRR